jgi:hypothetical protein
MVQIDIELPLTSCWCGVIKTAARVVKEFAERINWFFFCLSTWQINSLLLGVYLQMNGPLIGSFGSFQSVVKKHHFGD